jgi:hypothetical protein
MAVNNAVKRFTNDLHRLHQAERVQKADHKDLKQDHRALKKDRREIDRDLKGLKADVRARDKSEKALDGARKARDSALGALKTQQQSIREQLAADTFDYDPVATGTQQNPALLQQLDALALKQTEVEARLSPRVDAARSRFDDDRSAVQRGRDNLQSDRKDRKHDDRLVEHDRKELKHDRKDVKHARKDALEHLKPAEYQMSLKRTNTVRRDLGLKAVDAPIRPGVQNTVGGKVGSWIAQAQTILKNAGVPLSKMNAKDIAIIAQHESGGDPNAQNGWDSNAAAGTPSIGLMQTIGPTFNAYKLPGHGNIRNPVDNIIAATRYAIARYGSISAVPGVKAIHAGSAYVPY